MDNELKDILYYLDWTSDRRFEAIAAAKIDTGDWDIIVKRIPEPKESDLYDICYNLQIDSEKTWCVVKALYEDTDGTWHLLLRRKAKQEAENDNN